MIAANRPVMHVMMTADAVGGVWTYANSLIQASPDIRFTLVILGPPPSEDQLHLAKRLPNCNLITIPGKLEWMDHPWDDVDRAGEQLLSLADQLRPDLIHLNDYSSAALPFAQPVLCVGHSCVLSWWRAVHTEEAPRRYDEYRRRVTRGLRSADLVAAPSRAMLSALQHHYGPLERTRVIHNGAKPVPAVPPIAALSDRRSSKKPTLLAAGRLWDQAKHLQLLLEAAPEIPAEIRIAGDATLRCGAIEGGAGFQPAALPPNVTLLGRLSRSELEAEMARADIFIHPAKYEPFGLAPLEAALHRCALIIADIPSLREIWGDAATYTNPADPDALAAAIEELLGWGGRPARLSERQSAAHRRAQRYSLETFARSYHDLYHALRIRNAPRPVPLSSRAVPLSSRSEGSAPASQIPQPTQA